MPKTAGRRIPRVRLFAGVPAAPGCHAAGAVANMPTTARYRRREDAEGEIEDQIRSPSACERVVCERRIAERGWIRRLLRVVVDLVIPHQEQVPSTELLNHSHPVVQGRRRRRQTIVHDVARPTVRAVAESTREFQEIQPGFRIQRGTDRAPRRDIRSHRGTLGRLYASY